MKPVQFILIFFLLSIPRPSEAFVEIISDDFSLDVRGNVRINQTTGRVASLEGLDALGIQQERELRATGAVLRGMAELNIGESWAFEAHLVQLLSSSSADFAGLGGSLDASGTGRTEAFSWRWHDRGSVLADLNVDRLNLRWYGPKVQVTIGRQPVNLSTTYFFVPNDFFQAFSAQVFFRIYKPGVDAARVDVELGTLSQLTVVGVAGYDADGRLSGEASSGLLRASATWAGFEWALLGGKAPFAYVLGGSIQGEVFDWLGIRAEGHYAWPTSSDFSPRAELSFGFEHRFESSLHVQIEGFYHGGGATQTSDYEGVLRDPRFPYGPPYLSRLYAALGLGYELTPLLSGNALLFVNGVDGSFQGSAYVVYSLLDDMEAAAVASMPFGQGPVLSQTGPRLRSELGAYPMTLSLEWRAFF